MTLGQSLSRSYREFQQSWTRFADSVFGKAVAQPDEMARGEFISALICDGAPSRDERPRSGR